MSSGRGVRKQLKLRDPELGLKIALVAFLCTAGGAGISLLWHELGWLIMVCSMFVGFFGIGVHWRSHWKHIFRIDR